MVVLAVHPRLVGDGGCREEGEITIKSLKFEGVSQVSKSDLQNALQTKRGSRLPWGRKSRFSRAAFDADLQRIVAFYTDRGFPDARVTSVDVMLNETQDQVDVTVRIDEGQPTVVDRIDLQGFEVLSESAPLPFPIDEHVEVGEETRLQHRYLDLRRAAPNAAIRLRSDVNRAAREVLAARGFVEVETPTLTRSTPEGARDFLVPARLRPGNWYALPQSPQLFKQLLMVGGLERYYQIARCYRDEDFRADRQPEFTQLDVEMSFVDQDDVIELTEEILTALWSLVGHEVKRPIERITYAEAMARYGSDKPDLRLDLELTDCTEYFRHTPFRVFQAEYVGAVVMPGGASQPRKQLDAWQEWAKQRGARGLAYVLVQEDGELGGPVAKNLSDAEKAGLAAHVGAAPGDCVFFAAGPVKSSRSLLGAARLEIGRRCGLIDESAWSFVWHASAGRPSTRIAHVPHIATRHE